MTFVKSARNSGDLKRVVKAALIEVLDERQDLLFRALSEALEDVCLVRAMDEADRKTVSPNKIDRLLRRGR
jgi:hypothetical protein